MEALSQTLQLRRKASYFVKPEYDRWKAEEKALEQAKLQLRRKEELLPDAERNCVLAEAELEKAVAGLRLPGSRATESGMQSGTD